MSAPRSAACPRSTSKFLEWRDQPTFVEDVLRMLDNVLQDFIDRAPPAWKRASYAAWRERSVGLGVMGFHSFLQGQNIPFESAMAKSWNMRIFKKIRREADKASHVLAEERGACPDAAESGHEGALLPQARHRADRLDLASSAAAPRPASSRSRPISIPTRPCRAPSR